MSVNSENRIEFAITTVANFLVAATFAPLNPDYTPGNIPELFIPPLSH